MAKFTAKATAGAGIALGFATIRGAKFEQSMARVKAITNATTDEFDKLEKAARELGRTTQFSASQVAEAQGFFALAGFETNEILQALEPTLKSAVAGNLDVAQAADIAAGIMGGMGLTAGELGGAMEVLTRAFTGANTSMEEMGDAFKFVGPLAKSSGVSLEQTSAVLQIFADSAVRGSMAGRQLRSILIRLQAQPGEVASSLKELGISVEDQGGKLKHFADIIDDVNMATREMGTLEKNAIIARIAGAESIVGFGAALAAGGDAIRANEAALRAEGNTLDRMANVQMDTLKGAFLRLISASEGLFIIISKITIKGARPLMEFMAKAINEIEIFIERNMELFKSLGESFTEFIGSLGLTQDATGLLGGALDRLGADGETALERLRNGLFAVQAALTNLDLTGQIIGTTFLIALAKIDGVVRNIFVELLPTAMGNFLQLGINAAKLFGIAWVKAIVMSIGSIVELLSRLPELLKSEDMMADVGRIIADSFGDFGPELMDGLLKDMKDIPFERVLTDTENELSTALSNLMDRLNAETKDAAAALNEGIENELDVVIPVKVAPPPPGDVEKIMDAFLGPLAAVEFGTAEAFRADRAITASDKIRDSIVGGFQAGANLAAAAIEGGFRSGLAHIENQMADIAGQTEGRFMPDIVTPEQMAARRASQLDKIANTIEGRFNPSAGDGRQSDVDKAIVEIFKQQGRSDKDIAAEQKRMLEESERQTDLLEDITVGVSEDNVVFVMK